MTRVCILLIVCGTLVSGATQSRQLPAFALTAADGSTVSSVSLAQPEPWLLVVAQEPCRACEGTFAVMDTLITEAQRSRVVVVVANASSAQAAAMATRYTRLGAATWLRDPGRAALPALGVGGSPVVIGLRGTTVHWSRGVGSASPSDLESLISSWLQ